MRIEQLTFTRFLAAIIIVIYHFSLGSPIFNNEYVYFIFGQGGYIFVNYFFILSGFVMIIAYGNRANINFFEFIKNRLARIYPAYFLAILISISINFFPKFNVLDLGLNLMMIQSWFSKRELSINAPGWSLSVEFAFYTLFPILLIIYSKLKFMSNFVWIFLFWIVSQILCVLIYKNHLEVPYYTSNDFFYNPILHINEFLVGNLAGLFFLKNYKKLRGNNLLLITIVFIIFLLLLKYPGDLIFRNGLLAIVFVPLIILISATDDVISRFFKKKIFIFLGEISFGIYILQVPIWEIFTDEFMAKYFALDNKLDFTLSFFIRIFILIAFSSLSYLYLEKPLRDKIKNLKIINKFPFLTTPKIIKK